MPVVLIWAVPAMIAVGVTGYYLVAVAKLVDTALGVAKLVDTGLALAMPTDIPFGKGNEMWGTDMTQTITIREGTANVFVAVEHSNSELVGIHASRSANRFEALVA